jgi:hypothetical protein
MKILRNAVSLSLLAALCMLMPSAYAATSPSLGMSNTFGILAGTYSNSAAGTTINGDLGYTTGPTVSPTVNGTTHVADSTYMQAGVDQGTALANLNSQPCTFTFPTGAVNLATDTSHGTAGVYTPGVYCTTASSAASIGTTGITLSGSGTYIFRVNGALTSVTNSTVTLSNGASACNLFWTPTAATTLGATSTFAGTDIDASGITIGSTVTWLGNALAFGGTVSTAADTVSVPSCGVSSLNGGGTGSSGSTVGASNNLTTSNTNLGSSVKSDKPGQPDTGYGTYTDNLRSTILIYSLAASGLLMSTIGIRKISKYNR